MAKSSKPAEPREPALDLRMSAPELWELSFRQGEMDSSGRAGDGKQQLRLGIGFTRTSRTKLGVELGVDVLGLPSTELTVKYRAVFEFVEADNAEVDIDAHFREVAAGLAPSALFPFIREAVAATASRAGMPPLTLPIINFRNFFSEEDLKVPPFEEPGESET